MNNSEHNEENEDFGNSIPVELKNEAADGLDVDAAQEEYPNEDSFAEAPNAQDRSTFGEPARVSAATAVASNSGGLSALAKGLIVVAIIFVIGGGLVLWKAKFAHGADAQLNKITAPEMEMLLKDANPMMLKRLADDPELKKQQTENLKQLLAVASQARKDGLAEEPAIKSELENMRAEVLAVNYDQAINKDKGPMPPFGYIGEDRVKEFWADGSHEADFQKFLDSKLQLLKENNPTMGDRKPSDEELQQAKDYFAKIKIYEKEAEEKLASGELGEDFRAKVDLQTKLQQAQLLARTYAQRVLTKKTEVTDADVDKYIADHPELNPAEKKKKAEEILQRAKAGEDFAKLADEYSEDPGNKTPDGKTNGGLYAEVPKGRMMPEFETAALALEPGQIADNLVETPYGYHIIKLEKKSEAKDQSGQANPVYDVRHILISTTVKDSENPTAREMPVKEMVKAKLETEKQKQVLDEIVANNPVEIPEDYKVPEVSDEEMQKMQQQQMQQQMPQQMSPPPGAVPPGAEQNPPKTAAPKKDAKK